MQENQSSEPAKCPACGVTYSDHLGLNGTCKQLQEAQLQLADYQKALQSFQRWLEDKWGFPAPPFADNTIVECINESPELDAKGELVDMCRCRPPSRYTVEKCVWSPIGWLVQITGELHAAKDFREVPAPSDEAEPTADRGQCLRSLSYAMDTWQQMKAEPTAEPKGLYGKYIISKANGRPVDKHARYFVLRYDGFGGDPKHIKACRAAIRAYCDSLDSMQHLPELSEDLRNSVDEMESMDDEPTAEAQQKSRSVQRRKACQKGEESPTFDTATADPDGWIEWHRNRCPVEVDQIVQVIWREDGSESKQYRARDIDWSAITHYRIVNKPAELTDAEVDAQLEAAGIDMQPAFERLHKMMDEHKAPQITKGARRMSEIKPYKAKSITGAQRRVKELLKQIEERNRLIDRWARELVLLAKLAAKEPMFYNPLEAFEAEKIRDQILAKVKQ